MHDPIVKTGTWIWQMLNGHLYCFAVPGNNKGLWWFTNEVRWRWLKTLRREAKERISTGAALFASPTASFRRSAYDTQCLVTASTPPSEGGARCVSSARRDLWRGAGTNPRPYRDHAAPLPPPPAEKFRELNRDR